VRLMEWLYRPAVGGCGAARRQREREHNN
jgi:hypothetical protein